MVDENTKIYWCNASGFACIFTRWLNSIHSLDYDFFDWHCDDMGEYLTLKEIAEQTKSRTKIEPVLYVWVEEPLSGIIYQTNNHPGDKSWIKYGKTDGFA